MWHLNPDPRTLTSVIPITWQPSPSNMDRTGWPSQEALGTGSIFAVNGKGPHSNRNWCVVEKRKNERVLLYPPVWYNTWHILFFSVFHADLTNGMQALVFLLNTRQMMRTCIQNLEERRLKSLLLPQNYTQGDIICFTKTKKIGVCTLSWPSTSNHDQGTVLTSCGSFLRYILCQITFILF